MSGKRCGPHVELSSNDHARITRCTCGTIHVHLHAQGLTLRMPPEQLRHVANAVSAAQRLIDLTEQAGRASSEIIN
jgi:hypothetical protein